MAWAALWKVPPGLAILGRQKAESHAFSPTDLHDKLPINVYWQIALY